MRQSTGRSPEEPGQHAHGRRRRHPGYDEGREDAPCGEPDEGDARDEGDQAGDRLHGCHVATPSRAGERGVNRFSRAEVRARPPARDPVRVWRRRSRAGRDGTTAPPDRRLDHRPPPPTTRRSRRWSRAPRTPRRRPAGACPRLEPDRPAEARPSGCHGGDRPRLLSIVCVCLSRVACLHRVARGSPPARHSVPHGDMAPSPRRVAIS